MNQQMTHDEKRHMKMALVSYVSTHPVKSGLVSPYIFRYATLALASLVIVLGGSIGLTSASQQALPTGKLYPIKLWIEEYQAKNQETPAAIIAFETKRIENRFTEATRLAVNQELSDTASAIIQSGIERSRTTIKETAESIQDTYPELALNAASTLETTFSSNGKILASIEQQTNQTIGPIVLAAQVTTKTLALEKTKFEEIVARKTDVSTQESAEKRITEVLALLATTPKDDPVLPAVISTVSVSESQEMVPVQPEMTRMTMEPMLMTGTALEDTTQQDEAGSTEIVISPRAKAEQMIAEAQEKITKGSYSEALVLIEKASQILNEIQLTKSLEKTYQLETTDLDIIQ